jgi:hypothetical protein
VSYPLGERPGSYVSITPDLALIDVCWHDAKSTSRSGVDRCEAVAMMKSHVAWTGKYSTAEQTPDSIKTIAHVDTASSQAITGSDRVYFIRVDGNKLMMKSPGVVGPMTGVTSLRMFRLIPMNTPRGYAHFSIKRPMLPGGRLHRLSMSPANFVRRWISEVKT